MENCILCPYCGDEVFTCNCGPDSDDYCKCCNLLKEDIYRISDEDYLQRLDKSVAE